MKNIKYRCKSMEGKMALVKYMAIAGIKVAKSTRYPTEGTARDFAHWPYLQLTYEVDGANVTSACTSDPEFDEVGTLTEFLAAAGLLFG